MFACVSEPLIEPPPESARKAQNQAFMIRIRKTARDGDWLVTRGYKFGDDFVVHATQTPISHVGIYDAKEAEVIEAEGKGVHATPLYDFIDKSHRILVIRPRWAVGDRGRRAVENARALIGKDYDFSGTLGFNHPDHYYCSELAVHVYEAWHRDEDRIPHVIEPGQLYLWGRVLYDSLPRTPEPPPGGDL